MSEKDLLEKRAKVRTKIEELWFWIDGAPTDTITRIRYAKVKDILKELIAQYRSLIRQWLKERLDWG